MGKSSEFCRHNPCVASQRVFIIISVYFVIDPVRKLLDTPSYFILSRSCYKYSLINSMERSPFFFFEIVKKKILFL